MATGLQVFNAAGQVVFNSDDRLARILGTYQNSDQTVAAPANGSITVPCQPSNQPWFFVEYVGNYSSSNKFADFTISGATISWQYQAGGFNCPFKLTYGVY